MNVNAASFSTLISEARAKFFPMVLTNGVTGELVEDVPLRALIEKHWTEVFPTVASGGNFTIPADRYEKAQAVRQQFLANTHRDRIIFKKDGLEVGWMFGEQSDASTYYMRNTGILPAFQNQGIYSEALRRFLDYLRAAGFERVYSQHHSHNGAVLVPKIMAGFNIAGVELDERYGSLVRLTCLLHQDRQTFFKERFA